MIGTRRDSEDTKAATDLELITHNTYHIINNLSLYYENADR